MKHHKIIAATLFVVLPVAIVAFAFRFSPYGPYNPDHATSEVIPAEVTTAALRLDPAIVQARLVDLQEISSRDYWTGRLDPTPFVNARIPLPIFSTDGASGGVPAQTNSSELAIAEGTKFKVEGWSDIEKTPLWLRIRLADGREGLLESGFHIGSVKGAALPSQPYDQSQGLDSGRWQSIYDTPVSKAKAVQDAAHARLAKAEAADRAAKAKIERQKEIAEKSAAKKRGATIGMNEAEVIASAWGRPRKVNRTITAHGIREQWVYDGGYLYFRDGVLTTIQN